MKSEIGIYLKDEINCVEWERVENGACLKNYILPFIEKGSRHFISNSEHEMALAIVNGKAFPLTIGNLKSKSSCYLVSFLSQYFDYAQEEVLENDKYTANQKRIARFVVPIFRFLGNLSGMEKVVFINNYILSTSLYPDTSELNLVEFLKKLEEKFPQHALVFRSVNDRTEKVLLKELEVLEGKTLACRQLYMLDPKLGKYKKKRPFVMDSKLWAKTTDLEWIKVVAFTKEEKAAAIHFYKNLYIEKYSSLNPHYTEDYLDIALKGKVLDFYLLKDKETAEVKAVQAVATRNNVITTPFIGYDQSAPKEKGLYRLMNVQLTQLAVENNAVLNMSSGASKFKVSRGGEPCFEYHVVFDAHLKWSRKWIWSLLHYFSEKFVKSSMKKMEV
ncbi:hypothetical protein [Chondrinema litorale]|uniref:hypothetical protein n=1 Tax=Chondrinema litorale TaxID=2994555 RepID=UPI002542E292|nr:hypothetical protein [Chondrinema litorale]UZR94974.1 hypothetical protein OQ292_03990 [Chondrinema litorale]